MDKLRRDFAGGALMLTPEQIDALPDNDVRALYRALWDEIPETAQQALALATLAIPQDSAAWHNRLTGEAIAACAELAGCQDVAETLRQDRIPHGWARLVQEWLRRFNEPDQLRIAEEERATRFFDHEIDAVYQRLGQITSGLVAFSALLADQHRTRGPDHPDTLKTRAIMTHWRAKHGQVKEALVNFTTLLEVQQRVLGSDDRMTLFSRHNIALLRAEMGDLDHESMLITRFNIASERALTGKITAAISDFSALLRDEERIRGMDHPETLKTRGFIAIWRAAMGEVAAPLKDLEILLVDLGRVLEPDNPNIQVTRNWIAHLRDRLATGRDSPKV